ncbi:protein translocase SEC61 complex subunit gamma [Candidatus Woesearchaeota archaeon]|jgi:protein transport protein SEC61 subunit gamma and related proteins|nr:protein translocase SEC61 complex subunit gamma [Candidatus Woesearchaeota archaeon]MBT4368638.1 protein translocase SEC61 complex subunit gamma [Candidatus Woesearchaeota archaeon]MBT4713053.1 protein translocase SEC61 complex subunit gamma [Candidatus Woesearchaeota archaeon]MBT6638975.1 protein translocase SEC61 complex subunit gamma [Candidatus Woesearchaeota archaeon]MBT7134174.1 protein translocase SEC61 complex subunit gamma [Candidatus Woesearchaeota archaeon]
MDHQYKRSLWTKIKSFLIESKRVLKITKKPSQEEFKTIVKMSGLGILIIGVIGFVIQIIATLIK